MERVIFDLDGTLLVQNYSYESDYFRSCLNSEDAEMIISNIGDLLAIYESTYEKYDSELLRKYLVKSTGINFTNEIIDGWRYVLRNSSEKVIPGIPEILEYLKSKDYSLAVLTNWFSVDQSARLKNAGIYDYFEEIVGGDTAFKPNIKSYMCACGRFSPKDCVMIGDNIDLDVIGALGAGMEAIHFDQKGTSINKTYVKRITDIRKLKEMY